jgi:predicted RNA-binding Zn-ribbon protein involved in translation (DUF1610 family)
VHDRFWSFFALRPWRCRTCGIRFYAWQVPAQLVVYVHCPRCGNLDLQRVSRERVVEDLLAPLERALHLPAYRCDPCRFRFFSVRPFRRIPALHFDPSPTDMHDS